MKKRSLALLLAIVMVLSVFAGCGSKAPEAPEAPGQVEGGQEVVADNQQDAVKTSKDTLILALSGDPSNIRYDNDTNYCNRIRSFTVERLMNNNDGVYEYWLAKDIVQDDDGMGITITLRDDVYFSSGEKMKASDVKFSIQVGESFYSSFSFLDFDNIEILDDYKLHVGFKNKTYLWRSAFCGKNSVAIYSEKAYNECANPDDFWMAPVTTGEYAVTEWVADDHITLKANEYYFLGKPAIENLIVRIITEESVQLLELQTGGIDMMLGSGTTVETASADSGLVVTEIAGTAVNYLGLNHASPVFEDVRVRQAIAYLIDRDAIIDGALNGYATKWDSMFALGDVAYNADFVWPYERDVEKAKALLADAGVDPTTLTIRFVSDSGQNRPQIGEQVGNMLAEVGITLDIQTFDQATTTNMLANEPSSFDIYARSLACGQGESLAVYFAPASVGLMNIDESDAKDAYEKWLQILTDAGSLADMNERVKMYDQANAMVAENAFWIPAYVKPSYVYTAKNLQGIYYTGELNYHFHEAYFG